MVEAKNKESHKGEKYLSFRPTKIEFVFTEQDDTHIEISLINRTNKTLFYKVLHGVVKA